MRRVWNEVVYFLRTHDDIEMFVVGSLLATIAAFYVYCILDLVL